MSRLMAAPAELKRAPDSCSKSPLLVVTVIAPPGLLTMEPAPCQMLAPDSSSRPSPKLMSPVKRNSPPALSRTLLPSSASSKMSLSTRS